MKNILLPVDFSDTAKNTIDYALAFAQQIKAGKIILYNAFQPPIPADTMTATTDGNFNMLGLYNISELTESNKMHLERIKQDISSRYNNSNIIIEAISEFNQLRDGIEEICKAQNVEFIIMGITDADGLVEALAGSSSLDVAKHITTPVFIVPQHVVYKSIQQILFTCDYKNVTDTIPVAVLKNIVATTGAQLHVLHVDADKETGDHLQQSSILKDLLRDISPQYHTIQHADFKEAVNTFVAQNNIDLIIAIPKKHRFFEGLFHHSHTKTLAFHSHIPLLLMHDEKV